MNRAKVGNNGACTFTKDFLKEKKEENNLSSVCLLYMKVLCKLENTMDLYYLVL